MNGQMIRAAQYSQAYVIDPDMERARMVEQMMREHLSREQMHLLRDALESVFAQSDRSQADNDKYRPRIVESERKEIIVTRTTAPSWTEAEDEWLRECYPAHTNAEMAAFKALDGWPRDEQAIARRARTLGLRKDPSRGYVRKVRKPTIWSPEKDEWFRSFVPGHTEAEISAEHERLYGFPLRTGQIANRKVVLGVKSGTHGGRFAKGHVPANKGKRWDEWMPEASREGCRRTQFRKGELNGIAKERDRGLLGIRMADGYREIRVDPRDAKHTMGRWMALAKFNWMQANGRDWPDGCKVIHIDHDPLNDEADNIEPVPVDLWPMVMGAVPGQMEWHDRETLRAAILYARVTRARVDAERRARIAAGRPRKGDVD